MISGYEVKCPCGYHVGFSPYSERSHGIAVDAAERHNKEGVKVYVSMPPDEELEGVLLVASERIKLSPGISGITAFPSAGSAALCIYFTKLLTEQGLAHFGEDGRSLYPGAGETVFVKISIYKIDIVQARSMDEAVEAYRQDLIAELTGEMGKFAFSAQTVTPIIKL